MPPFTPPSTSAPATPAGLPTWKKIAYGSGDSGFSLTTTALALFYLDFLVNVVGLDPRLAGLSLSAGRIYDALNDIVVGTLSDRTRTRWGRRRPYLLFGTVPFAAAFVLMWLVPGAKSQVTLTLYYTAMYMLFDTLFTLVSVPYVALTPELAPTYDARTSLHSYRMAFSIVFGLVGAVAPLALVDALAGPAATLATRRVAYLLMAVVLGAVSFPPLFLVFSAIRERPEYQALPTPSIRESFRIASSNRAFLIAAGVYLLTWIPMDLIQYVLVFFIRDRLGLGPGERDMIFLTLFGVATAALPFWVWAAGRWDKKRAYQAGIAFLAAVLVVLSFSAPRNPTLVFALAALAGVGVSAAHAIPLAILPDVVEWDELRSGNRYEAAYYTVISLIQKLVGAGAIALTGAALGYTGYITAPLGPVAQPAAALRAIQALVGPLPALFFILGIVLVSFYPISRERHARIVRALAKKRALHRSDPEALARP